MTQRIFIAGITGVVGRKLVPLLRDAGYILSGATRSPEKAEQLKRRGIAAFSVDVFDAAALAQAVADAKPHVVIHQLTDLPRSLDPAAMVEATGRNARIRAEGTKNLVAAALAAGARRFIAQSIAWAYAPGPRPFVEDSALDEEATGSRGVSVQGVISLERQVLAQSSSFDGIILRYGRFYGSDAGGQKSAEPPIVHVDAAAHAAMLAIDRGNAGAYNVLEPCAEFDTRKAVQQLGWGADFRCSDVRAPR